MYELFMLYSTLYLNKNRTRTEVAVMQKTCQICLRFYTFKQRSKSARNDTFDKDVQNITNFINV